MPSEVTVTSRSPIKCIFGHQKEKGIDKYHVEWDSESKPTWETEKTIADICHDSLANFWVTKVTSADFETDFKIQFLDKLQAWLNTKIASKELADYQDDNYSTAVSSKKRHRSFSDDHDIHDNNFNGIKQQKLSTCESFFNGDGHFFSNCDIHDHILNSKLPVSLSLPFEFGKILQITKDLHTNTNRYVISWHYTAYETAETLCISDPVLMEFANASKEGLDIPSRFLQRSRQIRRLPAPAVLQCTDKKSSDSASDISTASTTPPQWDSEHDEEMHFEDNGPIDSTIISRDDIGCQTDYELDPFTCQYCQCKLGEAARLSSLRHRKKGESKVDDDDEEVASSKSKGSRKSEKAKKGAAGENGKAENDDDDDLVEIEYEVEKILDYRINEETNADEYYIKWKGYTSDYNSWEPESNLSCTKTLVSFYVGRVGARRNWVAMNNINVENSGKKGPKIPPLPPLLEIITENLSKVAPIADEEVEVAYQLSKTISKSKRWSLSKLRKFMLELVENNVSYEDMPQLRHQLLMLEGGRRKEIVLKDLKVWEKQLNAIAQGRPEMKVENQYDLCGPPVEFKYINDNALGSGVSFPDDPMEGCDCEEGCGKEKSQICCPTKHGKVLAYTSSKRLRVLPGYPIYECNKRCKCGPDCANRVVQDGTVSLSGTKLCIFRTSNKRGWGVKTLKKIKKGTFVCLYAGEIITTEEAESRGQIYENQLGASYLFDLDYYTYGGESGDQESCPYTIDATKTGNIAHFVNHSCDPNLCVFNVWADCVDQNLPKLAFFALRDINKDEELTYDYGTNDSEPMTQLSLQEPVPFSSPIKETETQEDSEDNPDLDSTIMTMSSPAKNRLKPATVSAVRRPCLCGAKTCRKVLF